MKLCKKLTQSEIYGLITNVEPAINATLRNNLISTILTAQEERKVHMREAPRDCGHCTHTELPDYKEPCRTCIAGDDYVYPLFKPAFLGLIPVEGNEKLGEDEADNG